MGGLETTFRTNRATWDGKQWLIKGRMAKLLMRYSYVKGWPQSQAFDYEIISRRSKLDPAPKRGIITLPQLPQVIWLASKFVVDIL